MRAKQVLITVAVVCACAGGPAIAAVAAQGRASAGGSAGPSTLTLPVPTGTAITPTSTSTTGTTPKTVPKTAPVPKLAVCLKIEPAVLAKQLNVKASAVRVKQRVGSNGMPQCNYLIHRAHTAAGPHTRVVVVVNVDNGAQAAWRLMRKNVEADQIFGVPPPGWKRPIGLNGLGPYAAWYPNLDQMMVNNVTRKYILTVSIVWWRAKTQEMIALARAAVLPYRRIHRFAK